MLAVSEHIVDCPEFHSRFDTQPFVFQHNLTGHELFTNSALHALATKAGRGEGRTQRKSFMRDAKTSGFLVVKDKGAVKWGSSEFHQVLDHAFEDFQNCNVRLKITAVHEYDGYRELLEECTQAFSEVSGVDFKREYGPGLATLFIASPNETTPYHIDEEVNFLLQIQGLKQALIFDGNDRNIVTEQDLEQFWFGRCFIQQVPGSAYQTFNLAPGQALFNPPFFPHLVSTGPQPSVSLSLGYQRRRFPEAEVHRMNAYMRKYGWSPSAPGQHRAVDTMKSRFVRHALSVKRKMIGE